MLSSRFLVSAGLAFVLISGTALADNLTAGEKLLSLKNAILEKIQHDPSDDDMRLRLLQDRSQRLIQAADSSIPGLVRSQEAALTDEQRQLYQLYKAALVQIERQVDEPDAAPLDVASLKQQGHGVDSEQPVVLWWDIEPPLEVKDQGPHRITFYGLNLEHRKNALRVGLQQVRPLESDAQRLVFELDRLDFIAGIAKMDLSLVHSGLLWNTNYDHRFEVFEHQDDMAPLQWDYASMPALTPPSNNRDKASSGVQIERVAFQPKTRN